MAENKETGATVL